MDKNFVFYIVKRYLRFDKDQPFIFLSALLAFLGICVGVMVLIIAMAIMNGFDKEFEKKLFTMNYPLTIYPKLPGAVNQHLLENLEKKFSNFIFSPYVTTQAILKKGDIMEGGILFGVDFEKEKKINDVIKKYLGNKKVEKFEAIVGKGIYDRLYINEGEKVVFIFTKSEPGGFTLSPLIKRFKIKGYFKSGLIAYDKAYVYTTIDSLRKILRIKRDEFSGIHIYSKNPQEDIKIIKKSLPKNVGVVGWWQQNGNFFAALTMEKRALFIVLMLIILIAALNIVSSLLMTVMNRRKEIALLLSLGATKKEIKAIFFYLGSIIGGLGIIFGSILGLLGIFILGKFDIVKLPPDVYGTSKLPLDLSIIDFNMIIFGAIIIILFSSYYPAKKATDIKVIDVLRNE
ncbi:ABC transporter permease [Nitrosophilus kaiyonis]|uniref:ABC transporter permease n=1 Tax=Nitrosophilus kaiyonis TaxID=2930200 RepID=UPI00248F532D|nr:ABC transporter permease [Nitrosophilus kaiyonis]